MLGPRLQEPGLWHINRKSCSGAVALGVFCAFMPIPFQMLVAAVGAIILRYNILIAVPLVWISNPVTIPPIFYFCYLVGARLLETHPGAFTFEPTLDWLLVEFLEIWQPFLLGCFVVGAAASLSALLAVQILWRYHVWSHLQIRRKREGKDDD